jgi:serine/threonine protein kinase
VCAIIDGSGGARTRRRGSEKEESTRDEPFAGRIDVGPILIVDDDEGVLGLVAKALSIAGYETIPCHDPSAALRVLETENPLLAIVDMEMPGMNGLTLMKELTREIRIPVIFLTGVDRASAAVRALRGGAHDYLTKPVKIERLLEAVSVALATTTAGKNRARIAHYELVREIGSGGMGVVYEAEDTVLERIVALKVLSPELTSDPEQEVLLLKEARAIAKVSHPGIVVVYEAGRDDGRLFVAMEFIAGTSLSARLREEARPLDPISAAGIALQTAEALEAAHEAGIVHHDLKPANVMLASGTRVKVVDFGLAKGVRLFGEPKEGATFRGTLLYASPEQLRMQPTDRRTDLYSLGVLLYEMMAGAHPFPVEAGKFGGVAKRIVAGDVARPISGMPNVPPALSRLVERMMAVDPEERPATAGDVAAELGAWLDAARRLEP